MKSMIRKYGKIVGVYVILLLAIIVVVMFIVKLLGGVGINISGTWIGFIGSVLGGVFTLLGVHMTISSQEKEKQEQKRKENMPLLGFEVLYDKKGEGEDIEAILTHDNREIITSGFLDFETTHVAYIKVRTINDMCAFDFIIEKFTINGKEISKGSAFQPAKRRITLGENFTIAFSFGKVDCNIWCVIRFSYKDILGNQYYQDVPFTYSDRKCKKKERWRSEQNLEIRDIKAPIFVKEDRRPFVECLKEYCDYSTFCKSEKSIPVVSARNDVEYMMEEVDEKRTRTNIEKRDYDFDLAKEKSIYCYMACIRNRKCKKLDNSLRFKSYQKWKEYLWNKYERYTKEELNEFSRHLDQRIRNTSFTEKSWQVFITVFIAAIITQIVEYIFKVKIENSNFSIGYSILFIVVIIVCIAMIMWLIWHTIKPLWDNSTEESLFMDYKEVIDEIIKSKSSSKKKKTSK